MRDKNTIIKLLAFILCITISSLSEDIIYLKNGGKLIGEVIKTKKGSVLINLGFGEMEVDTSEIAKIEWGSKSEQEDWVVQEPKATPEETPKPVPKEASKTVPKSELKIEPKVETEVESEEEPEMEPKVGAKLEPKIKPEIVPEISPKREPKIEQTVEQNKKPKRKAMRRSKRDEQKKQTVSNYDMNKYTSFHYLSAHRGIFVIGTAKRNQNLLEASNIPKNKYSTIPESAEIGIYYPKQPSTGEKYPLFLAMGPGVDIGISEINSYVQFADKLNFIVAAPELPPNVDFEEARYYYIIHIIEYLKEKWYINNKPIWIGGVSGGGQWALQLGVYGADIFSGIITIGRSDDFAFIADVEIGDTSVLHVPLCILNKKDNNLTDLGKEPYEKTIASIKAKGFTICKVLEYSEGQGVPYAETVEAFEWLKNNVAQQH